MTNHGDSIILTRKMSICIIGSTNPILCLGSKKICIAGSVPGIAGTINIIALIKEINPWSDQLPRIPFVAMAEENSLFGWLFMNHRPSPGTFSHRCLVLIVLGRKIRYFIGYMHRSSYQLCFNRFNKSIRLLTWVFP
jgi:hypothetical protein